MPNFAFTEGKNTKYVPLSATVYNIDSGDDIIFVNTTQTTISLFLPSILGSGLDYLPKKFYIIDNGGMAATRNISIYAATDTIVNGTPIVISTNNGTAECSIISNHEYSVEISAVNQPNGYVPYIGAVANVDLGNYSLSSDKLSVGGQGLVSTITALISRNLTGGTGVYGLYNEGQIQSDVTSTAYIFQTAVTTKAAAFTTVELVHYNTQLNSIGAGSSITVQTGFKATASLVGATSINAGFRGSIPSGNKNWNLYMDGTAQNYIVGNIGLGSGIPSATARLQIGASTTSLPQLNLVVGAAPASPNDGDIWREDNTITGLKMRQGGVTRTITLV